MQTLLLLLSLFAALSGARAQNTTCPQPVACVADPCDGAQCPRFLNTECRVDACHGECRATFFRLSNGKEVTNRCAAPTCAQTLCHARRTCMNTVVPTTCPRSRPNCRQYIKPQCVLLLQPQPPVDCSQVLCPATDRPFCEVRQTARGPRARCVPHPPPTSCEDVECDEGMRCRVREREGARPVVRCVPIRVLPVPRNCSQLECSDGFMCVVMDGKAMCVETPSPPDECDLLACEERNQECRIITVLNITRAICGPISDCSRLSCNESEGLECRIIGEGQTRFAFCTRTANCSKLTCNEGLECRVGGEGQTRFAFCTRTSNCSRIRCDESQGLECRVVGEGVFSAAVCLRPRNCSVLNPICRRGGLVCQEPQSQGDFAQASCVVATSCEQLKCNPGFTCIEFSPVGGGAVSSGSGILPSTVIPPTQTSTSATFSSEGPTAGDGGSGSGTTPTISITSPPIQIPVMASCTANSSQATCEDFQCEEDQVCSLQRYHSRNISLVTCPAIPSDQIPQRQSCSNTGGVERCSGMLCVDLVQDGDQVTFSCVEVNCTQQDGMCSTPGTECISAPVPAMNIDSVCVQTAVQFELGTGCGTRTSECTGGLACQDIQIEGSVVGTICNTPSSPVSCDNVECATTEECIQTNLDGIPISALCLPSSLVDESVSMILPQLP